MTDKALSALRPGERRFRELLRREREDVAMMARNLAVLYDSITFGRVSKPNTDAEVVLALFEERMEEACREAVEEYKAALPAASPALDYERLADDVRYGFVKSDYSRGFNDGIAAFIARLTEQEAADR